MELFRRIARRYNRADPRKADAALAAVFIAFQLLEAVVNDPEGQSRLATAVFGALALASLAWRRRNPMLAVAWFAALAAGQALVDSFFFGAHSNTSFVAALFMAYSTGRYLDQQRVWRGAVVLVAGITVGAVTSVEGLEGPTDVLWIFILFIPPLLAGQAIRSRVLLRRELREKAERLEAERDKRAMEAVDDERTRIASELQVVVANGLSAMVVQAEAVPLVLASGETEQARQAFGVIEETGRDALNEMRRLLGVLRRDGERPDLAPVPGLARLDALVERVREDGLAVGLVVDGERRELAPGVDLTAYRVVQEGLRAAAAAEARHAIVTLRYGARDIDLEVSDDRAAGAGDDDAVTGLRERVSLYSGHVRGTLPEGGGYVLEARLPTGATAAATVAGGRE